jgi:inhibitor of KinA sporulation pathway (predicted exonuclease)
MRNSPQIRETRAPDRVVVFDLEYTAWPHSMARGWLDPGEFREIIQIGAVAVSVADWRETEALELIVRPRINPCLSDFIQSLTGVNNETIAERGIDFEQAYARFVAFADGAPLISFGRDDRVLMENARLYGLRGVPFLPRHINIGPWLYENGIDPRGFHACDVARLAGVALQGHGHDALYDARSVTAGIAALMAKGAKSPLESPS